jgi:Omp85 superfamily domain
MKTKYLFLPLLVFFISFSATQAQEENFEAQRSFIEKLSFKGLGWKNLLIPIAGYEPVTRVFAGMGALSTRRLSKDSTLPVSFSEFDLVYTQNHQIQMEDEVYLYLGNRYIVKGYAGFAKFPDKYFGLGNHTTNQNLQRFDNFRYYANMHLLRKVKNHLYIGAKYRLFAMYDLNPRAGDPPTLAGAPGENGSFSSGLGYSMILDTRDNLMNSQRGVYVNIAHSFFHPFTGSQYTFNRIEIDARKFIPLNKWGTLALQWTSVFTQGAPPFPMMALLGSDADMRGYYKGRYRDLNYFSSQAEYRKHLFWRLGMVAFAGGGNVVHSLDQMSLTELKYSLGGGLRLLIDKKENVNLRIDYAIGFRTEGLYVYLAEAF